MDHYTSELERRLPEAARKQPAAWMKEQLKRCAAELLEEPGRYRLYGSYWWGLKHLIRHAQLAPRTAWFHGPCADENVRKLSDHGSPLLNLQAALSRARLWDDGPIWLERPESGLGICEWPDGQVELYRLSDTDTGHQLDLFEMAERQEKRLQAYLDAVTEFLPRTWRAHGDEALEDHDPDRAAVCYQRMAHLSANRHDRSEAWLLLGMTFDQKHHWNKAIFCYRNLYEKENEHWILGNIAASHLNAGQAREAVTWYEQALKHMPGNPEFQAGLESARLCLRASQRANPDNEQLPLELAHA